MTTEESVSKADLIGLELRIQQQLPNSKRRKQLLDAVNDLKKLVKKNQDLAKVSRVLEDIQRHLDRKITKSDLISLKSQILTNVGNPVRRKQLMATADEMQRTLDDTGGDERTAWAFEQIHDEVQSRRWLILMAIGIGLAIIVGALPYGGSNLVI